MNDRRRDSSLDPNLRPVECIIGDTVRKVRVWTEEEWARFNPAERPRMVELIPGLGWVGIDQSQSSHPV
jgi:hypothetical protein